MIWFMVLRSKGRKFSAPTPRHPVFTMQEPNYHWTACRHGAFFSRIYSDRIENQEKRKDLKK
jgi:hypothetical protein